MLFLLLFLLPTGEAWLICSGIPLLRGLLTSLSRLGYHFKAVIDNPPLGMEDTYHFLLLSRVFLSKASIFKSLLISKYLLRSKSKQPCVYLQFHSLNSLLISFLNNAPCFTDMQQHRNSNCLK